MIDNFSLLLSHALLAFALWRLMNRADVDAEDPPLADQKPAGFVKTANQKISQADGVTDA